MDPEYKCRGPTRESGPVPRRGGVVVAGVDIGGKERPWGTTFRTGEGPLNPSLTHPPKGDDTDGQWAVGVGTRDRWEDGWIRAGGVQDTRGDSGTPDGGGGGVWGLGGKVRGSPSRV